MALGLFLLTNLHANTDRPTLWLWMLVAGVGIGPSFAVFTLIVQNSVQPDRIGVATSSLTFFQQIGGTIGLTLASTILANRIATELPIQLGKAGVPFQAFAQIPIRGPGQASGVDLFATGNLGQNILNSIPEAQRAAIAPIVPNIVQAVHEAFTIALASTFWIGIGGALIAAVLVLFLHEVPMRDTFHMEGSPAASAERAEQSPA